MFTHSGRTELADLRAYVPRCMCAGDWGVLRAPHCLSRLPPHPPHPPFSNARYVTSAPAEATRRPPLELEAVKEKWERTGSESRERYYLNARLSSRRSEEFGRVVDPARGFKYRQVEQVFVPSQIGRYVIMLGIS